MSTLFHTGQTPVESKTAPSKAQPATPMRSRVWRWLLALIGLALLAWIGYFTLAWPWLSRWGDPSYGIYLSGCPIAQAIVATWPEMRWLESRFRGRRWLAVTLMVLLLMLLFMVPLLIAVSTIYGHTDEIRSYSKEFATIQIPAPPDWLAKLPFIGEKLQELWEESRTGGPKAMLAELTPYADNIAKWAVAQAGSLGTVLIQFLLTVILSAVLYMGAESAAQAALRFGQRLAGRQGETSVILAGQSILEGQAVVWKKGKEYNDGKGTLGKLMSDRAKAPKHAHLAPDQSGRRNTVITSL